MILRYAIVCAGWSTSVRFASSGGSAEWTLFAQERQPDAPTIAVLSTVPASRLENKYIGGDHAGFWETSAILGVAEMAAGALGHLRVDSNSATRCTNAI